MRIIIHAHHVDITQSIKEYVENKLSKLDKFFHNIQSIHVDLDVLPNAKESDRHQVSVKIFVSKNVITASDVSKDMYATIDTVFEKLEKQLVKHKDKLGNRVKQHTLSSKYVEKSEEDLPKLVRFSEGNYYKPKPVYLEDAMTLFDPKNNPVFVFRNAETEAINVLFALNDQQIGLIEP